MRKQRHLTRTKFGRKLPTTDLLGTPTALPRGTTSRVFFVLSVNGQQEIQIDGQEKSRCAETGIPGARTAFLLVDSDQRHHPLTRSSVGQSL